MLKNWALTFLIKNVCDSLLNLATLFQTRNKAKKILCVLEFNQLQWLKLHIKYIHINE